MAVELSTGKGKVYHHGIETLPKVTYQGWEPGREYTKNIVLKNVNVRTQKITYESPASRFFSTLYPQPIVLSAGTSYVLPVTFRPLDKNVYEDSIRFASKEGDFEVPIKAVLPEFAIELPSQVDLPHCATQDMISTTFSVSSRSELVTPFQWLVEAPFTIEPREGEIKAFGKQQMTVFFRPTEALAFECDASLNFGDKRQHSKKTMLKAIGKFPHLFVNTGSENSSLEEKLLEFGNVSAGSQMEKFIEVVNLTDVEAKFTIEQPAALSSVDTVFVPQVKKGVVSPRGSTKVKVTYTPQVVTPFESIDYFHISSISKTSRTTVKCTGQPVGPAVSLSTKSVDFARLDVGDTATRVLEIVNHSETPATYAFQIDCEESVFKLDAAAGTIGKHETRRIIARFVPMHPINYYRRVACVVANQSPVFLDLIGTAHSETVKPAVLEEKHVRQFKILSERGLSMFPPEHLNELRTEGQLTLDDSGCLMNPQAELLEPLLDPVKEPPTFSAYFDDGFHSDLAHDHPHVSLDVIYVDFGQCADLRSIESKSVTLKNYTKGKVTVQWMGDESHTFSVSPSTIDIPPLKTASFRIHFKPSSENNFFSSQLECFCYYKSLRDYRLVEDVSHVPPFCVTLTATASTFGPRSETFLPRVSLSSDTIVFPAVNLDEASYRTLTLTNTGTTPVKFNFTPDDEKIFSVKPTQGVIADLPQIITFKVLPNKVKHHRLRMKLQLNDMAKNNKNIALFASAESAQVLLGNSAELYFPTTCVGSSSTHSYMIKNISRMPLQFQWVIAHADRSIVSVTPKAGVIAPNENQTHKWTFAPASAGKVVLKPRLIAHGVGLKREQSCGKERAFPVRVLGEGATGGITADQSYFDFGDVIVGSSKSSSITLVNGSDCGLHFKLTVDQSVTGPYTDTMTTQALPVLELEETQGVLPARSKRVIRGRVKPVQRVSYRFDVSYQLLRPVLGREASSDDAEGVKAIGTCEGHLEPVQDAPYPLCHVLATGVFPLLSVIDGRASGSGAGVSKKQLWSLFQLDSLNSFLDSDPTEKELRYSIATRHSTRKRPPVFTRAIVDFNFGASPVGTEPCQVTLYLANTGTVPTDWEFLYPTDLQLDLEYWADSGQFDEDELHQMKVMDNKLFTVEPKKGHMEPGERQALTLTYKHIMAGTDRLPVLMKLSRGREILLNFIGVTVEPGKPYVHFPGDRHSFAPTPVGESNPPTQIYELYNGGSVPVEYVVDTRSLEDLREANFDHEVLACLNPAGTIAPGKSAAIEWIFSPLEVKTYEIDLPIHVSKGDTALITFSGAGYARDVMGDTMSTKADLDCPGVPAVQTVPVPGQMLYLSQERADFGNVPLFCQSRRVVYMKNTSDSAISFTWHVSSAGDEKMVSIFPASGMLEARDSIMMKVTFTSVGSPAYYDLDLVCEMVDETLTAAYRRKLRDWEAEQARQAEEWTITDMLPAADAHGNGGGGEPVAAGTPRRKSGEVRSTHTVKVALASDTDQFKAYKTLPPIVNSGADKERAAQRQKACQSKTYWAKPSPPQGFLVHLGVTARTHSVADFQQLFPDDYSKFFIDHTLGTRDASKAAETSSESPVADQVTQVDACDPVTPASPTRGHSADLNQGAKDGITCTEEEGDALTSVLSNILRSLVGDPEFHTSVRKVAEEATPYFQQFTTRQPQPTDASLPELQFTACSAHSPRRSSSVPPAQLSQAGVTPLLGAQRPGGAHGAPPPPTAPAALTAPMHGPSVTDQASQLGRGATADNAQESRPDPSKEDDDLLRSPELSGMLEDILENTLLNILQEASSGEINITARPRLIALPPRPRSAQNMRK